MMLKKSLLAISLAAAVGTVNAGTLNAGGTVVANTTNPQKISNQSGLLVASLAPVTMTIGSTAAVRGNYTTLDKVKVTITGATLSASSNAVIATSGLAGVVAVNPTYPDTTTILFDVASAASTPAVGSTITVSGIALALTAGQNVSMTIEAISSVAAVVIDSASGAALTFANEFAATATTKADAVISFDRLTFSGPTNHSTTADVVTVNITDAALDIGDITSSGFVTTATLNGDFSFLDANGDGDLGDTGDGTITSSDGTVAVATGLQKATITSSSAGSKSFTVTLPAASKKVQVPAASYSVDASVAYTKAAGTAGSVAVASGLAAGSWTLDGSTRTLQFMPFGRAYANSITVTNTSAVAGNVTVTITGNGKTTAATVVGTAAAKSVTQVGPAVAALAAANGITEGYVSVTTNAANAEIVGVYYAKADGDRVLTK